MNTITFIYRLRPRSFVYYGKIRLRTAVMEEHAGLDRVIRPIVLTGIHAYRRAKGYTDLKDSDIQVGVLGLSNWSAEHCSDTERDAFDFYAVQQADDSLSYWMNGQEVEVIAST